MASPTQKQRDRNVTREVHRIFWRALLQDRQNLILTFLLRLPAFFLVQIYIPLQVAYGVEAVVTRHFEAVGGNVQAILIAALIYTVLWGIGIVTVTKNAITATSHVQQAVFTNYLQKDYEFYGNTYLGSLGAQASRLREAMIDFGRIVTLDAPKQTVVILAGIIVIAYNSPLLALTTLIGMGFVLSYTIWSSSWRLKYRRRVSEAASELSGVIGDALSHGTTIKSFSTEGYETKQLSFTIKKWGEALAKIWLTAIPTDTGRQGLAAITMCVLLLMTSMLYQNHSISIAIVALVQIYVIKMVTATVDIADTLKAYEAIMGASYEPVRTMMIKPIVNDPPKPHSLPKNKPLDIKLSNISYLYPEASKHMAAVSGFDLEIQPGEKIGLVGHSGSGKTTLSKLLLRFMDVNEGHIALGGIDIRNMRQQELRKQIAYVPQEPLLFHRTIRENIAYGRPNATEQQIVQAAKLAYVEEFVDELPQSYNTLVGERGVKLSGGQRQRIAIARAILKDAPILVLDEATSALDSHSEQHIQDALWHLMKDRTALVIAHRLSTIQRMDRIVVMEKGKIIQTGTHKQLLEQPGIYSNLWQHQSGGYLGGTNEENGRENILK
jgi:ATP-binding cassette subfamily B protein